MRTPLPPRLAALGVLAGTCLPLLLVTLVSDGCGSVGVGEVGGAGGAGSNASTGVGGKPHPPPVTVTYFPDAAPLPGETECKVVETTGIWVTAVHLPICTPIAYATNPPSGGDHWPTWTTYAKHDAAVPREMYVHNMEHGAVVIAYRCQDACPEVVLALEEAFDQVTDALCLAQQVIPPARVLLTPDPELDAPIAVAAWGATYVATCLDEGSIQAFIAKVLDHGTEKICGDGVPPELITASCVDGGDAGDGGDPEGG